MVAMKPESVFRTFETWNKTHFWISSVTTDVSQSKLVRSWNIIWKRGLYHYKSFYCILSQSGLFSENKHYSEIQIKNAEHYLLPTKKHSFISHMYCFINWFTRSSTLISQVLSCPSFTWNQGPSLFDNSLPHGLLTEVL